MELAHAVTEALERLRAAGRVEVQEDGAWLAALEGFGYEVREQGDVVLLHLWSAQRSLVRRVLGLADNRNGGARGETTGLALEVARLGHKSPSRLEFAAPAAQRPQARIAREQFRARFRDLLLEQFPDEKVTSLTNAADLKHSLSGSYTRGTVESDSCVRAVMAAAPDETPATLDAMLTFGLLWFDRVRQSAGRRSIAGLRLFFPTATSRVAAHRMQALAPGITVELYEYNTDTWRARKVDTRDLGNIESWLAPRRDVESILSQAVP